MEEKGKNDRSETGEGKISAAEAEAERPRAAELLPGLAVIIIALLGLLALFGSLRGQRVGFLLADGQGEGQRLALAVDNQLQRVACGGGLDELDQIIAAGDRFAVHRGDDVIFLQTCLGSRAVFRDGTDSRALRQAIALALRGYIGDRHADIGLDNITVRDDRLEDRADLIERDGEADVVDGCLRGGAGGRILCVCDADHLAVEVEQRTAGVAGIDGAVSLDEVHGRAGGKCDGAVKRADRACRQ